jgi:hypothetical protein
MCPQSKTVELAASENGMNCQIKRLGKHLYACLVKGDCQYAVFFGNKKFCKNQVAINIHDQASGIVQALP